MMHYIVELNPIRGFCASGKFSVVYEGRPSQQSLMIRGTLRNRGRKKLLCTGLGSTFQL